MVPTLQPRSGRVVSREIADKRHKMDLAVRGGLKRTTVSESRRKRAALTPRQLGDLTKLAKRVKKLFGGHQDIEFAVHNGKVHLLQARPVTATKSKLVYTLVYDNSMMADDAAREADRARRTATFMMALGNMKILAEGGTLPSR